MSFFKKFQQLLGAKLSVEQTVDLLTHSLSETSEKFITYDGIHARTIQRHMQKAEENCKKAFALLSDDEEDEAAKHARSGLVHLQIAHVLISKKPPIRVDIQSAPDTTEGALNQLIHQIAKVKLLVEYGDLQVNTAVQDSLLAVMKIFDGAVADLKDRHLNDAARQAGAALVALHWTVCLLEENNPGQDLSKLKLPTEQANPAQRKACDLANNIVETRIQLGDLQALASPEVSMHLVNAERKFNTCVENLIDGDMQSTGVDARAGLLDLQMAMRAAKESALKNERRQNQQSRNEVTQFKFDVHRTLRLADQLDIDYKALTRRMEAAEDYFIRAHRALDKMELVEAERTARAAHLDLDFCWQILNARKAEYRQDI